MKRETRGGGRSGRLTISQFVGLLWWRAQCRHSTPLHSTPLHTSLEMFHPDSEQWERRSRKVCKNIARLHLLPEITVYFNCHPQTEVFSFPVRKLSGFIVSRCFKIPFLLETRETFPPQSSPHLHPGAPHHRIPAI